MAISEHLTEFAGLRVRDYEPGKKGKRSAKPCVYRVGSQEHDYEWMEEKDPKFVDLFDQFLDEHGRDATALVIGAWNYEAMTFGGRGAADVVEVLVAARKRLPNLTALFFGDITYQECEISWIQHGDLSPLLPAFPRLEEFHIRGASRLTFGAIKHNRLKHFAIESGGLPAPLLQEVFDAKLPRLEHLELWLGREEYGGIANTDPLQLLLAGKKFRKLRYLGLRNSEIADQVARAVANSKLVERIEVLDLSLGNLTDQGAEALLGSSSVRKLKKLDLHHHFISEPFVEQLKELPIAVDVSEAKEPEFHTWNDQTHVYRYIVASE